MNMRNGDMIATMERGTTKVRYYAMVFDANVKRANMVSMREPRAPRPNSCFSEGWRMTIERPKQ